MMCNRQIYNTVLMGTSEIYRIESKNCSKIYAENNSYSSMVEKLYEERAKVYENEEVKKSNFIPDEKFTKDMNEIIPPLYNAIKNGDLQTATNLAMDFHSIMSCSLTEIQISGDWISFNNQNAIFYKGQNMDYWEENSSIMIDSYTKIKYFELDGYAIPTREFRGKGYDKQIAKIADESGSSYADVNRKTIFAKSSEIFNMEHKYKDSFSPSQSEIQKMGLSPFNRILFFLQQHKVDQNITESDLRKELEKYIEFEKRVNNASCSEKDKLLTNELLKIIDNHIDIKKKYYEMFKKSEDYRELFENRFEDCDRNFNRQELDYLLKTLNIA